MWYPFAGHAKMSEVSIWFFAAPLFFWISQPKKKGKTLKRRVKKKLKKERHKQICLFHTDVFLPPFLLFSLFSKKQNSVSVVSAPWESADIDWRDSAGCNFTIILFILSFFACVKNFSCFRSWLPSEQKWLLLARLVLILGQRIPVLVYSKMEMSKLSPMAMVIEPPLQLLVSMMTKESLVKPQRSKCPDFQKIPSLQSNVWWVDDSMIRQVSV